MRLKYQFINGDQSEIQITDDWGEVVMMLDKQERNDDHRETRRHISLNGMDYEGALFAQKDERLDALLADDSQIERLKKAVASLKPEQQALIKAVFFDGMKISDFAKQEGVSQPAITQRLNTVLNKLRKLF